MTTSLVGDERMVWVMSVSRFFLAIKYLEFLLRLLQALRVQQDLLPQQ
jgi:hypothetical protein